MLRQITFRIVLQLFLLPLLFTRGVTGGEERVGVTETAWLTFSTHDIELVMAEHENATIFLLLRGKIHKCLSVNFTYEPAQPTIEPLTSRLICPDSEPTQIIPSPSSKGRVGSKIGRVGKDREDAFVHHPLSLPSSLYLQGFGRRLPSEDEVVANVSVEVVSRRVGKTVLSVVTNYSSVSVTDAFVRVSVIHTRTLDVASDVVGWIYTIVWDVSFLPQVFLNWRRKSVEGYSMDNIAFNFFAYLYYSLFNIAFCWIPLIKDQFKERYPRSVNHVQTNDVIYALYGFFIVVVQIVQCFLYGWKAGSTVSWLCVGLLGASVVSVVVECVLVALRVVWWIDVFYLMSYIKLIITSIKCVPQIYIIYRIKSTKGFSLIGVLMDFIGGIMSLAQMFLLSANSDDYLSIFTNFSKFGIGAISVLFDLIYFGQHWYYHLRFWKRETTVPYAEM